MPTHIICYVAYLSQISVSNLLNFEPVEIKFNVEPSEVSQHVLLWCGVYSVLSTGCPVCLVLEQGAVNQLFFEVFLMFLACLGHARWAEFHLGILGPQE